VSEVAFALSGERSWCNHPASVKPCPFCAESIQEAAVKCRFCGSMLDGSAQPAQPAPRAAPDARGVITIFDGSPSWKAWFWSYVGAGVLSLVLVGLIWMLILNAVRKSLRYKLTDRTIDYEKGVFSKQIETLQLWRVQDIDFRQSFFERLLGVASIYVFTKDRSDPELVLRGLPASREIFDKLKDAADLARQQRVVGLVQ
jgi:membrane protein YdbS with pleckstrin-like domain